MTDVRHVPASHHLPSEASMSELQHRMQFLTVEEQALLSLRLGLDGRGPRHIGEVSHLLHLRRAKARELEARALSKLQHPSLGGPWY